MPPPADSRTDAELIDALNAGDASAFDALYYRYRDWVARLAYRFCGNDADALDVLQDTFVYLSGKFPGFRLTASLTTFLYPVVKHHAQAARRKRVRHEGESIDANATAAPDLASVDARSELLQALASLPEAQREVVLMRFVDGLSLDEIAVALTIPLGTVKSRLHNALTTLRSDPQMRRHFGL